MENSDHLKKEEKNNMKNKRKLCEKNFPLKLRKFDTNMFLISSLERPEN